MPFHLGLHLLSGFQVAAYGNADDCSADWCCNELQTAIVSVILATLFIRPRMHSNTVQDASTYSAIIFFVIVFMLFDGFTEVRSASDYTSLVGRLVQCLISVATMLVKAERKFFKNC